MYMCRCTRVHAHVYLYIHVCTCACVGTVIRPCSNTFFWRAGCALLPMVNNTRACSNSQAAIWWAHGRCTVKAWVSLRAVQTTHVCTILCTIQPNTLYIGLTLVCRTLEVVANSHTRGKKESRWSMKKYNKKINASINQSLLYIHPAE